LEILIVDMKLRYRCAQMPECVRGSRVRAVTALLRAGWARELVEREIDGALAWAKSQAIVHKQEKYRRRRVAAKEHISNDDALDAMFTSMGHDPAGIPRRN
jgi:hypothetical protein